MVKRLAYMACVVCLVLEASAQAWLAAPASYSCRIPCDGGRATFVSHTVKYSATNITLFGLLAVTGRVSATSLIGDPFSAMFSEGPCESTGTDMAAGAWGWSTGAVFAGTVTVATNTVVREGYMPVGYVAVGTSAAPAVITVGGRSVTVTGSFDRTIGPVSTGTQISMTTTGYACIGIIKMASNEWYQALYSSGQQTGENEATGVSTNAGFFVLSWANTPTTNTATVTISKYGASATTSFVYHASAKGYIAARSQMRIIAAQMWSPNGQIWRFFGWRAYYGTPTALQLRQWEIDARAEYSARLYGQ